MLAGEDLADLCPLVVGVRPMLDPAPARIQRVVEVGDVAGGVNTWSGRLEALVDNDPVVQRQAAPLEELAVRKDAYADDGDVRLDAEAALRLDVLERVVAAEARDLFLEQDVDTMVAVDREQLVAQLTRAELVEQTLTHMDQGDGKAELTK
jgi:hypothetical protein